MDVKQALIKGLQSTPKYIPVWYRYDKQGSEYNDRCLEENNFYYFYSSEISVIKQHVKVRDDLSHVTRNSVFGISYLVRRKPAYEETKDGWMNKGRNCTIRVSKTIGLMKFVVTAQLICAAIFA